MANILSVDDVTKSYGDKALVDHISFGIDEGQRIGLIGVNGTGKSTLLKLLAGLVEPDSGHITMAGQTRVHYLPQEPEFKQTDTVLDAVFQGDLKEMATLRAYETTLHSLTQTPDDQALQQHLLQLQMRMEDLHVWELEHDAKSILTKLGVQDFDAVIDTLSGGQRKRVALARALIQPCDLLILDEPTNHIDDDSAAWLESHLGGRKGALLMVTHDRYFLDRVVNRIFELHQGRLTQYPGDYETFLAAKAEREAQAMASEEKRQNFLRNELKWVQRGARARGTKQKARMDRYDEVLEQDPEAGAGEMEMTSASSRLGKSVIELKEVYKAYPPDAPLISDFSYIVLRTDRVGIVGPNGMGKTTLLKLMSGQLAPDDGEVIIGSTVKIGYFSQEHEEMPQDVRVIDYIREEAEYVTTAQGESISAGQMLERFLFPGNLQWTPIVKLSGGEKRRLALLKTLMSAPNVLFLDEPTNDLDIPTLTILESYLDDFQGAVIVVSHDRYFLDVVCDKIFSFDGDGEITVHFGNFQDYLERRTAGAQTTKRPQGSALANGTKPGAASTRGRQDPDPKDVRGVSGFKDSAVSHEPSTSASTKPKKLKFTWAEEKEYETINEVIAKTEASLQEITRQMESAASDYGRVQELYQEQQSLERTLDGLLERWTYLTDLAEKIEEQRQNQ